MTYEVILTARAECELRTASLWIARSSPEAAIRWFEGFVKKIATLETNPLRAEIARESHRFPIKLRQLPYGRRRNYRALFTIRSSTVVVLSIRHASQRDLEPGDFYA